MAWYVRPPTAPVCCEEYLKHELFWHGCITHVIYPLKKKQKTSPPPYTLQSISTFPLCHTASEFGSSLQYVLLLDALFGLLTSVTPSVQFVFSDMYLYIQQIDIQFVHYRINCTNYILSFTGKGSSSSSSSSFPYPTQVQIYLQLFLEPGSSSDLCGKCGIGEVQLQGCCWRLTYNTINKNTVTGLNVVFLKFRYNPIKSIQSSLYFIYIAHFTRRYRSAAQKYT